MSHTSDFELDLDEFGIYRPESSIGALDLDQGEGTSYRENDTIWDCYYGYPIH